MSEFVFNDIYGNESARERYSTGHKYSYFNTILKLHNKYYQDPSMHNYIFSPRTHTPNPNPNPNSNPRQGGLSNGKYTYYNVQKINNLTYRISKNTHSSMANKRRVIELGSTRPPENTSTRNILKNAEMLQSALQKNKTHKNKNVRFHNHNNRYDHNLSNVANITSISR